MENNSLRQFSLASDPGIPSANEPRVAPPMSLSASSMTGDPQDSAMYQGFYTPKGPKTLPRAFAKSTMRSSTYTAQ